MGKRIVILGDLLYDCFVWADRLPRRGETVTGYQNGFFSGGKGSNQAVEAARLGAEVHLIGKVGDDERGAFLLASLQKEGIDTEFVTVDPEVGTGTCCVQVDGAGNNAIIVVPLANERITDEEIDRAGDLLCGADVFLSQLQVNESAVTRSMELCRKAGVPVVLNPAPARAIPDFYYRWADYLTPNETEAEFFSGCAQAELAPEAWRAAVAARFAAKGARNLIVTLGGEGAFYSGGQGTLLVPPWPVQALDSTAAGDAFNAAFCLALAEGRALADAIAYANGAGALTASRRGSQPSMPTAAELDAFLLERGFQL